MVADDVQEKLRPVESLKAARKEAQEIHREIMLARANYAELINSLHIIGQKLNELYERSDSFFERKQDETGIVG